MTCLFENMLQSLDNTDYVLNTEPMQIEITRNFYKSLHSGKQANLYYYKVPLLNYSEILATFLLVVELADT